MENLDKDTNISWSEIYNIWISVSTIVYGNLLDKINFVDIPVRELPLDNYIGWWPRKELQRFIVKDKVEEYFNLQEYDGFPRRGVQHTSEMLFNCSDDKEKQSLILLSAYILQTDEKMPNEWHGNILSLIMNLALILGRQRNENNILGWHGNTKQALPTSITLSHFYTNLIYPNSTEKLVYLVALEVAFSLEKYQLVRLVYQKEGIQQMKSEILARI